mmetsp:Transcript_36827/g.105526  ORF Transcript_36827/g.105526 Transcript_36827/m.105526 type:complete len:160 (-) Transcript_36827:189-668(-)
MCRHSRMLASAVSIGKARSMPFSKLFQPSRNGGPAAGTDNPAKDTHTRLFTMSSGKAILLCVAVSLCRSAVSSVRSSPALSAALLPASTLTDVDTETPTNTANTLVNATIAIAFVLYLPATTGGLLLGYIVFIAIVTVGHTRGHVGVGTIRRHSSLSKA